MSTDDLDALEAEHARMLEEKEANDLEIASIKAQLIEARAQVWTSGEYADPDWLRRATYAAKQRGQRSQTLQRRIGESGRLIRKLQAARFERCFVDAARTALDPSTFERVWANAQQLSTERRS
jgi:hypothetical protein